MNKEQFAEKIIKLRKKKGYTQAQLAELLNVSNKAVSRWETAEGYPDITLLKPLSEALGVSCDELLGDTSYSDLSRYDVQRYLPYALTLLALLLYYVFLKLQISQLLSFAAFLGMMMKMAEVSLAVYYRSKDEKGGYYGGPTYYMEKGLGRDKGFKFWGVLAVIFGIGIFGNVFSMQNFTVAQSVNATFGIPMLAVGLVYVGLTYLATVREIPWLGKLAAKVVPPMCVFYLVGGIVIIIVNITQLPAALGLIISDAFTGTAATGAFMGAGVALIIRTGLSRAMFSSEAGWGTSPMIHASAKTEHPVKQGLWGAFEVFVGTMCICTVTSLVIVVTGLWDSGLDGAPLTLAAFETVLGPVGTIIITVAIFLFALSTTTGWWAYFEVLLRHLCGTNEKLKRTLINVFKVIYPIPGFLVVLLAAVGNDISGADIWEIANLTTGIPAFVNLIVIVILSGKFFQLLKDYKARYLGIGTVDPNFRLFDEEE